tara:strand:+ start:279 stop:998 length:720 start_codon:yes stop_codon:yes gene_type:complete
MKLTIEKLKSMIEEVYKQKKENSMILDEATFSSVKGRVDVDKKPDARTASEFVVMSSDRGERSPAENLSKYKQFKQKVKAAGFPFTEFIGQWIEKDEETGEKRKVQENSVIIYSDVRPDVPEQSEELFELGKRLSKEYSQEAFIYGELVDSKAGKSRVIQAFDAEGKVQNWGGPWSSMEAVKEDDAFWSRVRGGGTPFQFKEAIEEQEVVEVDAPNSVIEAMKKSSENKGKKIKFVRRK